MHELSDVLCLLDAAVDVLRHLLHLLQRLRQVRGIRVARICPRDQHEYIRDYYRRRRI